MGPKLRGRLAGGSPSLGSPESTTLAEWQGWGGGGGGGALVGRVAHDDVIAGGCIFSIYTDTGKAGQTSEVAADMGGGGLAPAPASARRAVAPWHLPPPAPGSGSSRASPKKLASMRSSVAPSSSLSPSPHEQLRREPPRRRMRCGVRR
ncbi:hypothetical protein OsJ_27814 [Oryza sativa Japonica Group]|uniref:Uncharacterized protein n=1 Tax=Oryza sativa subsp. japonica TaxID=39947 RepID=B9G1M0_ORYSJ|nr:hypothetical protein OsJ_27814 [Oryza sativa Japonica Group]